MHQIGFIVPRRFQLMSLAALTVFEIANMPPTGRCYDIHLLSEHGGPVESSGGMTLETEAFGDPAFDTVIVGSITEMKMPSSDATMIAFVKETAKASRRITSIWKQVQDIEHPRPQLHDGQDRQAAATD